MTPATSSRLTSAAFLCKAGSSRVAPRYTCCLCHSRSSHHKLLSRTRHLPQLRKKAQGRRRIQRTKCNLLSSFLHAVCKQDPGDAWMLKILRLYIYIDVCVCVCVCVCVNVSFSINTLGNAATASQSPHAGVRAGSFPCWSTRGARSALGRC